MFYARVSIRDFNYEFIKRLFDEARIVMRDIAESNLALEEDAPA
jgi:hypothetical protein